MNILLVTYMRDCENISQGLISIASSLKILYPNLQCVIFIGKNRNKLKNDIAGIPVQYIKQEGTKYSRLLYLLQNERFSNITYFISIDNDMIFETNEFINFINNNIDNDYDIGWGRIQAQNAHGMWAKLVQVDKLLSHNIIRPFLWKIKQGISIPGQCFIFRSSRFKSGLMNVDSYLDDIAIGLFVNKNQNNIKINFYHKVIGYEYPNITFKGLCKQRKRWAKGFYDVLKGTTKLSDRKKIIIHATSYHCNWIFNITFIIALIFVEPVLSLFYMMLISLMMTIKLPKLFLYGIIYQVIFPIFHIIWIVNFFKGNKNAGNE